MNITVQVNKFATLHIPLKDIEEAQITFMQPEMERLMTNPSKLTTYLELHEPSFSALLFEYFTDDDLPKLESAMRKFEITDKMFIGYVAHCFNIPQRDVTITY